MWRTPDDCTAVVRVMQEFDRLAAPHEEALTGELSIQGRLNFDESPSPNASLSFLNAERGPLATRSNRTNVSFGRSTKEREKDVELFRAKGRICQLENDYNLERTGRKRARNEQQKETETRQGELRRQTEKMSDLQQQLKYVVEEEKNVREKLKGTRKELDDYKKKSEEKVHSLQRQKLKLSAETEESKEAFYKQVAEIREKLTRQEMENNIFKGKLEESESQLEYYKKRYSEASRRIDELEDVQSQYQTAGHKVKELEQELARREDAAEAALTIRQISKYHEIECENSTLKEENAYLKATNKSNLLLQEKLGGCQNKLKRAEEKLKSFSQLEIECEKQKKFITKWEAAEGTPGGSIRSPEELLQELGRLQQSQVLLSQRHRNASTSARISSDALRQKSEELLDSKVKLSFAEEKYNEQSEQMKRVNKLLSLVSTERNACRRLLNSYDSGDSTDYTSQLSNRAQQAEEQLQACNVHIGQLENDLKVSVENTSEHLVNYNKLKLEYEHLKQCEDKKQDEDKTSSSKQIQQPFKAVAEKLELKNKELLEKVHILEARIEQRNLQGDFDPSQVKIIHFSQNPLTQATHSRSQEMEQMKTECEALRRKLKMLQEQGEKSKTAKVEHIVIDEPSPSDIRDLQAQVLAAERKNQRLKEVFSQKIQEFREACYSLTGYRIDVVQYQQYRLKSMYAERSSDDLLFQNEWPFCTRVYRHEAKPSDCVPVQNGHEFCKLLLKRFDLCNSNGKTMLLETDFSLQVKSLIDTYLKRYNSIPAFLSSVTIELFERQTQMIN